MGALNPRFMFAVDVYFSALLCLLFAFYDPFEGQIASSFNVRIARGDQNSLLLSTFGLL